MNFITHLVNMNREDIIEIVGSIVFLTTIFAMFYFAMWIFY
jgi:preprotein translocase subunit YajC